MEKDVILDMASQALKFHADLKLRAVTERPMAGNGT